MVLESLKGTYRSAEAELPLDLGHGKLAVWLVDRRLLPGDWRKRLQLVHRRVEEAAQQQPAPATLQADQKQNYWAVASLRDRLAESAPRTLLGGLTGPAAAWDSLVRAYESGNVFLGEAALLLVRNVDYEVPFLKQQIQKGQQQLSDLERRKAECLRSAELSAKAFQQECQHWGIEGRDISRELSGLPLQLPSLLCATIQQQIRRPSITQAAQHYSDFSGQLHAMAEQGSYAQELLPALNAVLALPDAELVPPALPPDELAHEAFQHSAAGPGKQPDQSADEDGINWDLSSDPPGAQDSAQAPAHDDAGVGIDWDVDLTAEAHTEHEIVSSPTASRDPPAEIDWDIDISGAGLGADSDALEHADMPTAAGSTAEQTASAHEQPVQHWITRLIDQADERNALLDDLLELLAFLKQRHAESSALDSLSWTAAVPEALQHVTASSISAMLAETQEAVAALSSDAIKQLLLIKTSPSYTERLTHALQRTAGQEAKFKRLAADVQGKYQDAQRALVGDSAKLAAVQQETWLLKANVESRLSSLLHGREVNIFGINIS